MLIKINQPVEITASRQTVTLIADHFGDQIVGLSEVCTGRFLSLSLSMKKARDHINLSGNLQELLLRPTPLYKP